MLMQNTDHKQFLCRRDKVMFCINNNNPNMLESLRPAPPARRLLHVVTCIETGKQGKD